MTLYPPPAKIRIPFWSLLLPNSQIALSFYTFLTLLHVAHSPLVDLAQKIQRISLTFTDQDYC